MRLACRIDRVSLPSGHHVDGGDLARQVERELRELLTLFPASPGERAATQGPVKLMVTGPLTTHNVAHAIARHIRDRMEMP